MEAPPSLEEHLEPYPEPFEFHMTTILQSIGRFEDLDKLLKTSHPSIYTRNQDTKRHNTKNLLPISP